MKRYWRAEFTMEAEVPDDAVCVSIFAHCPACESRRTIHIVDYGLGEYGCSGEGGPRTHQLPALILKVSDDGRGIDILNRDGRALRRIEGQLSQRLS